MDYEEKLLVGHRWYEKKNIKPLFPFGFGLSYTDFSFSNLEIIKNDNYNVECKFKLKNVDLIFLLHIFLNCSFLQQSQ